MRAVLVEEFGPVDSHKLGEIDPPTPGAGEVLIDIHAIGINFPDTLMMQGLYQTKPERPFTPGRDVAGVISGVGDDVTGFKVGDRVMAIVPWGAYAETCVAQTVRCFHLPDDVDYVTAAGMATVYMTSWVALMERGGYQPGDKVLILGASGGVGLAAVQIAKAHGAFVVGGSSSEERGKIVLENGADAVIDLSVDDINENLRQQVFAAAGKEGVDIVLDPLGGDIFTAALRTLAFAGRIVCIGFIAGIPTARANYFNVKNVTLVGMALDLHFRFKPSVIKAAAEDVLKLLAEGKIAPRIEGTYDLNDFQTALSQFKATKSPGKLVLTTGRS
ncbi:MAG: NADPH:quinone oxidoreductase [Rhodospirillaceae bacterium]|nr:NADPH:quinone oxidoreductase [Rhodospirillaceae bacterium]|tara:strand:- start:7964 stop:8956 length:993 start_codon:yes stop_codon:yes gene_type:complete